MASITSAANAIADHNTETVLPRIRDSLTRGLLRRIILLVRQVMGRWYRSFSQSLGTSVTCERPPPPPAYGYQDSGLTGVSFDRFGSPSLHTLRH